jgi:hypothetical protein
MIRPVELAAFIIGAGRTLIALGLGEIADYFRAPVGHGSCCVCH